MFILVLRVKVIQQIFGIGYTFQETLPRYLIGVELIRIVAIVDHKDKLAWRMLT